MSALTLVEAAKLAANEGKTLRAAVIAMFARASDILMAMPFKNIQGNAYAYNREGALPGIAFRGVNEGYVPSVGVINPLTEALRICGGDLDVDQFITTTMGEGVRAAHEALKVKALAAALTTTIIKGDSETNPREFDGLQKRITGSQLIENGTTNGGDPLSLTKLDEAIDATTNPTHIIMSKAMRRRITTAARTTTVSGFLQWDRDAFGRQIAVYNDLPILVPYSDNGGTEPLAFNELASTGANATATSIYVVGFGDGLVSGIQSRPMDVRDLGELDSTPASRTRVEWYAGMCIEHGRAATRLRGISDAAVAA
jgi:hypothetical protein